MFSIDVDAVGPELAGDFVAGEELAGAVQEQTEDLKRLRVEAEADALAAELAGGGIGFECAETIAARWVWVLHVW